MTLEEAMDEILSLKDKVKELEDTNKTLSQNNETLTNDLEKSRTLTQKYYNKLIMQETNDPDPDPDPVPTLEEFAETLEI